MEKGFISISAKQKLLHNVIIHYTENKSFICIIKDLYLDEQSFRLVTLI